MKSRLYIGQRVRVAKPNIKQTFVILSLSRFWVGVWDKSSKTKLKLPRARIERLNK